MSFAKLKRMSLDRSDVQHAKERDMQISGESDEDDLGNASIRTRRQVRHGQYHGPEKATVWRNGDQ